MVGRLCVAGRGGSSWLTVGARCRSLALINDPHVNVHASKLPDEVAQICLLLHGDEKVLELIAEILI